MMFQVTNVLASERKHDKKNNMRRTFEQIEYTALGNEDNQSAHPLAGHRKTREKTKSIRPHDDPIYVQCVKK